MANLQFNIAKGRINELQRRVVTNDPATCGLVVVLLKTAEADAALQKHATVAAILAAASVEVDFTGHDRKILTDADLSLPLVDNVGNVQSSALPTNVWTSAGGTLDNTVVKGLVCYVADVANVDNDASLVPLTMHDLSETTNGNNLNLNAGTYATSN